MIRPSALLLATLMASPALYMALVTEELSLTSAMARFLLAVPAAALMLAALRFITATYGDRREQRQLPLRRRTDPPSADTP
jgi:hypothetical protein